MEINYQKAIRKIYATSKSRQVYNEKPLGFSPCRICKYCGTYGNTPPNIMPNDNSDDISTLAIVTET